MSTQAGAEPWEGALNQKGRVPWLDRGDSSMIRAVQADLAVPSLTCTQAGTQFMWEFLQEKEGPRIGGQGPPQGKKPLDAQGLHPPLLCTHSEVSTLVCPI